MTLQKQQSEYYFGRVEGIVEKVLNEVIRLLYDGPDAPDLGATYRPLVLYMRDRGRNELRDKLMGRSFSFSDGVVLGDKDPAEALGEFEASINVEAEVLQLKLAFDADPDKFKQLTYGNLKSIIGHQQAQATWVPPQRIDNIIPPGSWVSIGGAANSIGDSNNNTNNDG